MKSLIENRRPSVKLIVIIIMVVGGFNLLNCTAYGLTSPATQYHIESDFILWKPAEKMLGTEFTIHLYYINNETNNTNSYTITINNEIRQSNFTYYINETYTFPDNTNLFIFKIEIGNKTLLSEKDILIMGSVTGISVKRGLSGNLISLNPLEWNAKERNVASGVVSSAILCMFISFVYLKYWRAKFGIKIRGGE